MAYGSGAGILSALDALHEAGVATTTYQNVQDWGAIKNLLYNSGYSELVNDAGYSMGWVRTNTALVEQTSMATSETLPSVIGNASGVYDLAASEYVIADAGVASASGTIGEAFTALVTSPKAAVIASVLSAIGFAAGFDIGQDLVDKIFFNDETFDWATDSIGGKIMTWIDKDGNAYLSADLVERIKDVLIDNGLLDDVIRGHDVNVSTTTTVSYSPLHQTAVIAYNLLHNAAISAGIAQEYSTQLSRLLDDITTLDWSKYEGTKIGRVALSFGYDIPTSSRFSDYQIYGFSTDKVTSANLVYPPTQQTHAAYVDSCDWMRIDSSEGSSGYINNPNIAYRAIVEILDIGTEGHGYGRIELSNIGELNTLLVPKQPGATYPTPGNTIGQDYPTWWGNRKKLYTPDENDPNKWRDLLHLRLPTEGDDPQSQDDTQTQPETKEQLDEQAKTQEDIASNNDIDDNPPTDDIGGTPPIIPPTSGSGTGLVKLYNPTLSQLATFSQWLWSNNVFDNFSKLFQDPMQAIIGLNLLYATPHNGQDNTIVVGNLDSSCPSKTIDEQYINIDCGTVKVSKYFNNVLDYIDTKIELYLPFVGIVSLDGAEVVGKQVNVKCTVDVLTGTCLYQIYVGTQLLYTYTGNCAVQLPLSSANYSSVITGMIGLIGGGVATAVSGGALAPLAIGGAANALSNVKHNVERSGNIGSNAGAMGEKKPYLIITRHKPYNPTAYNKYYGYPSNTTVKLNRCSGFTRVKDIRLHDIYTYDEDAKVVATDNELTILDNVLKGGIII